MKKLLTYLLLTVAIIGTTKAQYNNNGIPSFINYFPSGSQSGSGGITYYNIYTGQSGFVNWYFPNNIPSQTVTMPGTYQYKKVEQNASPTGTGTIYDTLFTAIHRTEVDSVHGTQNIVYAADAYATAGVELHLKLTLNPGDSARTVYIKYGATPVDTVIVTNTSGQSRSYFFDGSTLQPDSK